MANLVSDIMSMATPMLVDKMASNFGVSGGAVNGVLAGAVPGILGGLINKSATPGGAGDILSALSGVNPNVASGLASALGGGNAASFANQGTSMLSSLLGQNALSGLTSAVMNNAGISSAAGAPLMGLAAQMAMGALAKHTAGQDPAGLARTLAAQKGAIQAALPPGIANALGMPSMGSASYSAPKVNVSAPAAASAPTGNMGWLAIAIPALVVLGGLWYFASHRTTDDVAATAAKPAATTEQTAPAAPAAPAAGEVTVGDVNVTKNLTGAFGDLTSALGGITDVASANAALPKIQGAGAAISAVSAVAAKFSPEQKTAVASLINGALPAITGAATKAQGIAGVGDILKPVLDAIIANLTGMTK